MEGELGLRERKKLRTRQLIAESAWRLFAEYGFDAVPVAAVARAAEVSEATVFNYFPTKEDLVFQGMEVFETELLAAVADRPAGEPVVAALARFLLQPRGLLAAQDDDAARYLTAISRMIAASPALLAREREVLARYTASLATLLAEDTAAEPGDAVLDSRRCGQHQDPRASALADQRLAHAVAVDAGKIAVEHDHVVVVDRGSPQAGLTVVRDVDGHALALQTECNRFGQLHVVLDHQHAHSPCKQSGGSAPMRKSMAATR